MANRDDGPIERAQMADLLRAGTLFAQFRDKDLDLVLETADQRTFAPGQAIVHERDVGREVFLILAGRVEVRKGLKCLAELGAGQFFGEMAFLNQSKRSADVVALGPTRCLVLNNGVLHDLLLAHPRLGLKMMRELARRLRNTDQEALSDLERRVADRTRELKALYEVTAVAGEALDLDQALARSLDRTLQAMDTAVGAVELLEEDGSGLHLAVHRGIPADIVQALNGAPSEQGLGSWVLAHGEPLVLADIAESPRAPGWVRAQGVDGAYAGVPMRAKGRVLGVLSVFRDGRRGFNVEDVALLASIADQVGVVVENARLRLRAERAAVREERGRLARDLHDSVTQSLYSLTLFAEAGRRLVEQGEVDQAGAHLAQLGETAQQALKEVRLLVYELRPSMLEQAGLSGALQQRLGTVEERAGVRVRFEADGADELPKACERELYHIAQEALNNALKHGAAGEIHVRIASDNGRLTLEVEDDGRGFDPHGVSNAGGVGMNSMRERAERIGGTLRVASKPGAGTRVWVEVAL